MCHDGVAIVCAIYRGSSVSRREPRRHIEVGWVKRRTSPGEIRRRLPRPSRLERADRSLGLSLEPLGEALRALPPSVTGSVPSLCPVSEGAETCLRSDTGKVPILSLESSKDIGGARVVAETSREDREVAWAIARAARGDCRTHRGDRRSDPRARPVAVQASPLDTPLETGSVPHGCPVSKGAETCLRSEMRKVPVFSPGILDGHRWS